MWIGIDIGTHTARAAWLGAGGRPELVQLPGGGTALPALARQTMHGLRVGAELADTLVGNAETTVVGCTRLMGRAGQLPAELLARLPYPVREQAGEAVCDLLYAEVRAAEVYGALVRELAGAAERATGEPVGEVVLTVPASAEDRFRVQARAAAEAQGLRVRRLISQPAAALLAAAHLPRGLVAVVNCGGGATEVSIAECGPAGARVLATAGDPLLGGDDMAWAVARGLNERFRQTAGLDVFAADDSRLAAQGLRAAAERALEALAVAPEFLLALDHGGGFGRDLITPVRRADLAAWLAPALGQVRELCRRALAGAGISAGQLGAALLLGDWAYLPDLRLALAGALGHPVGALLTHDAPALAAYGAALAGATDAPGIWDVTPYPLGINCYYGETELFSPIIAANTPIPTPPIGASGAFTESYSTRHADQTSVTLDILQFRGARVPATAGAGRVFPHECEPLGRWEFGGLHPPRGRQASFTVTFAIDADGILQLYAQERGTGHALRATVDRGIG